MRTIAVYLDGGRADCSTTFDDGCHLLALDNGHPCLSYATSWYLVIINMPRCGGGVQSAPRPATRGCDGLRHS